MEGVEISEERLRVQKVFSTRMSRPLTAGSTPKGEQLQLATSRGPVESASQKNAGHRVRSIPRELRKFSY